MILVAGESLIDLIMAPDDGVHASPGGGRSTRPAPSPGWASPHVSWAASPPTRSASSSSGSWSRTESSWPPRAGLPSRPRWPSWRSAARVCPSTGSTSPRRPASCWTAPRRSRRLQADVTAVHVGTLGLVVDPMASELERLVERLYRRCCSSSTRIGRPQAIPDADTHRARLRRLPDPDRHPEDQRRGSVIPGAGVRYRGRRADPARLGRPLRARSLTGPRRSTRSPAVDELAAAGASVKVVDTVGAGDAFGGSFLAWWAERGLARDDLVHSPRVLAAVTAAARVASLTCARAGAEPPWRHELDTDEEWGQPLRQ